MMKNLAFGLIALFLWQCNEERTTEIVHKEVELEDSLLLNFSDLANKVFYWGADYHFTDSCKFYFECDCCASEIVFNNDTTFYLINYCVLDESFLTGKYHIFKNSLQLNFSEISIYKSYLETDTTGGTYVWSDSLISLESITFIPDKCKENIILLSNNEFGKSIVADAEKNYEENLNLLNIDGYIRRIDSLNLIED